jgi:hypothetical protein
MNNQFPYGFMPPFFNDNNINERLDNLEKTVKKLEKKVSILENSNIYPPSIYPNNYMM